MVQPIESFILARRQFTDDLMSETSNTDSRYKVISPRVFCTNTFEPFTSDYLHGSIISRFEEQVSRNPGARAIYTFNKQYTYDELNSAANQVARILVDRLAEHDKAVGMFIGQGALSIAAILGILKAGKFYVPLHAAFSSEQKAAIIARSKVALLLADNKHSRSCERLGVQTLNLEKQRLEWPSNNLDLQIPADAVAYTLHTSGSTGKPKAVVHTHRNVLHNVMNYTNGLHISAEDRLTLLTSATFGASVSAIFGALLNGASLYPFDLKERGFQALTELLKDEEITIYHSIPSVYRNFLSALAGDDSFPKLRVIKLGGDSVTVRDVELFKKHFHRECLLHVGLGSTEVHIVRQFFLNHDTEMSGPLVPVGYEVPGTEVTILDDSGQLAEPGSVGEIAIRSEYLPLGNGSLYRTGDLGLIDHDGCLFHLGRMDCQVKIRGYRVQLTEVELALQEFPGVKEAAVSAVSKEGGEKTLVAYLVSTRPINTGELRRFLRERLADYMLPSHYVFLDALPSTANGKVDRTALAEVGDFQERTASSDDDLIGPTERRLAAIWKEILSLDRVGRNDNFFEAGGDSLMSLILVTRMTNAFKVDLPGNSPYQHQNIASLAALVDGAPRWSSVEAAGARTLIQIAEGTASNPPVFIVPGGQGGAHAPVTSDHFLEHLAPDLPVYALVPRSADGKTPGHTDVTGMASDYIEEIRKVQPTGPYFLVGGCIGGPVAFEMARQLDSSGDKVALLAMIDGRYTTASRWLAASLHNLATSRYLRESPQRMRDGLRLMAKALRRIPSGSRIAYLMRLARTLAEEIEATFHAQTPTIVLTKRQRFQFQYRRTLRQYRPGYYSGDLKLILSDEFAEKKVVKEWQAVVGGTVEAEFIPGQHKQILSTCAFKTAQLVNTFYRQAIEENNALTNGQEKIVAAGRREHHQFNARWRRGR